MVLWASLFALVAATLVVVNEPSDGLLDNQPGLQLSPPSAQTSKVDDPSCPINVPPPPPCSQTRGKSCIRVPRRELGSNCTCEGIEQASNGPGPRKFSITCSDLTQTITCTYKGNPHHCTKYNNNGQEMFYGQLLDAIGGSTCRPPVRSCPMSSKGYHTALCQHCSLANFYFDSRQ